MPDLDEAQKVLIGSFDGRRCAHGMASLVNYQLPMCERPAGSSRRGDFHIWPGRPTPILWRLCLC